MQITTTAILTTLIVGPIAAIADTCYTSPFPCNYLDEASWMNAAEKFCGSADNRIVKKRETYKAATFNNTDTAGVARIFTGSYRVKFGRKDHTIHALECASYMRQIFAECGGVGGIIETEFGIVTALCIIGDAEG